MKKLLLTLFSIGIIGVAQAQMTIDELYQDSKSLLLSQSIIKVDSMSTDDLQALVLNWSGMSFRNASKVLVNQTKSQMVFRYSTNSFHYETRYSKTSLPWYFKMLVEFRQGGVRVSIYDNANAYTPGLAEGTYYFTQQFKTKDGLCRKSVVSGLQAVKNDCTSTILSLQEYIQQNNQTPTNSNW